MTKFEAEVRLLQACASRGTDGEARHLAGDGAAHILSRRSGVATAAPGQNGKGLEELSSISEQPDARDRGPLITMKEYA